MNTEKTDAASTISRLYDTLLPSCSVRTKNVLSALQFNFPCKQSFLNYLINISKKEIHSLRNAGHKTTKEILELVQILKEGEVNIEFPEDSIDQNIVTTAIILPDNIDILFPIVISRANQLSARANNVVNRFMAENGNSLKIWYEAISKPNFSIINMRGIGRTTEPEISQFFSDIKSYVESFIDNQSVENEYQLYTTPTLSNIDIPKQLHNDIYNLEHDLGYFPLFAVIKAYLSCLNEEYRKVIEGCIRIQIGQTIKYRDEVGSLIGLTGERVRQIRNDIISRLTEYFSSISRLGLIKSNPYQYQMVRINEIINATEGTNYTLDFVNWVIGSTFDDITIIGDVIKTLTSHNGAGNFLCLVPTKLCKTFDFTAFIDEINTHLAKKRINEEYLDLQETIDKHSKVQYSENELQEIEVACRSILYLHFPVEINLNQIIFKPNSRKSNYIIVEDIIRAARRPLTLREIYKEFIRQYPDRYTELSSFRGTVNNNPNIIPIGRTSTYRLAEFESDNIRNGTIRDIIECFLESLDMAIASISDVVDYIHKFRPTADERSVTSNIALDKSGIFAFYYKNGIRYIGFTNRVYPIEYFPSNNEHKTAISQSIQFPQLISFIEQHGHFPFSSNVDEKELQLSAFWMKQESKYKLGKLSPNATAYFEMIINNYWHLNIDKREYEWRQSFLRFKEALAFNNTELLDDNDWRWYERNCQKYKYDKNISVFHKECIEFLISQFSKT